MAPPASYYNNYADAAAKNYANAIAIGSSSIVGTINPGGNIGSYTHWKIGAVNTGTLPTGTYPNGFDLNTLGISVAYLYPATSACFLEGTKVLCQVEGVDEYIPIETLKKGTLVKTSRDGYKKVEVLGKGNLYNPGNSDRIENRLYRCSPAKYPELTEDLYITGCHSILVDTLTDKERADTITHLGLVYVTDKKYRLIACVDERAHAWESEGNYTIWHVALENTDITKNYGIFVNGGLLVETCSINLLVNKAKNMTIVVN